MAKSRTVNELRQVKDTMYVPPTTHDEVYSNMKMHKTTKRPWGTYEIIQEEDSCKVKKITVNSGEKLSYQFHYKRYETWCVTEGTGIFTLNDINTICGPGYTLTIPRLAKHTIENTGKTPLIFIEVQRGSYFGEDDIVRLEDNYGRA